eukprot:5395266-Prymnesium_polylepis.1
MSTMWPIVLLQAALGFPETPPCGSEHTSVRCFRVLEPSHALSNCTALEINPGVYSSEEVRQVAAELTSNTRLTCLRLLGYKFQGAAVQPAGARALAKGIKKNAALKVLDLSTFANSIGVEGGTALAKALEVNTALTTLRLRGNRIGDDGVQALSDALMKNT